MSNSNDKKDVKSTLAEGDIQVDRRVGRRSALAAMGTVAAAVSAVALVGAPSTAQAKVTDSDPTDLGGRGRGRGTGRSDSDPNDAAGMGRTGRTDSDPSDGAGRGRGPSNTGRTDSDPNDRAGQGRH